MKFLRPLYMQVLLGVVLGCIYGHFAPASGASLQWIAAAFIKLITMLISPIIFCTIVAGIGNMSEMKKVGTVGIKALLYFEVVTTLALLLGLLVVNLVKPGAGFHVNPASLDTAGLKGYLAQGVEMREAGVAGFLLKLIPGTFVSAFTSGEILQVLLISVLFGIALVSVGEKARPITSLVELCFKVLMRIVGYVVLLAPLASFAAMAFVVGKYGLHSLVHLGSLLGCVYGTMVLFIALVLTSILLCSGLSLWRLLRYLKDEIWLVIGTSSSETALPGLMEKLEQMGCSKPIVGLVVPAGYSFNLDGTCIYLTMAAVFIAQATDTPLRIGGQLGIILLLLLYSKGAAAVTGGGFVTLAATLQAVDTVPVAGLSLILGVDRFMSQARALTNLIGNAVAVVTIARWEGELDKEKAKVILARGTASLPPSREIAG